MREKVVKEVELDNNQTLIISDASRKIADDAYLVRMNARINIPVEKNLFSGNELKELFFEDIVDKVGLVAVYEFAVERNFIMAKDKDKLFEKLEQNFFETLGKYISKPNFPKKLILKQYKDRVDNKTNKIKVV
ncbi:MAG: hypothetical protein K8R67_09505 [Desulfobacteraceae bacterium]|nr:hypothetical protein [Desulfobacteraceae bacterium]